MSQTIRLNRYLASCGIASRRKAEIFIKAGRVKVNGNVVTDLSTTVNDETDRVTFDGKPCNTGKELQYILLNKPAGIVTTASDEFNRKAVVDLVSTQQRIFPVGRLDKETEGVLLLTNDGDLAYQLTHPRFEIEKIYIAVLDKPVLANDLKKLRSGIRLEDGRTSPCRVELESGAKAIPLRVKLTLHEGKKRQVRRMFQALGYHVKKLRRISFAGIRADDLNPGQWRHLTQNELAKLKKLISKNIA
ncbi:rRNA pseudouridine synthase [candidate division KSB1 bacterium]|nr:rRNA pseudouridine synthase [candidate division KSB1 bacterium]